MKTKILALAQIKGGCGKTTISAHLAGHLCKTNTVAVIDSDVPQLSLTNWFNSGPEKENLTLAQVSNAEELLKAVDHFDGKVDYIVIDLAPRLADLTRAGIAVSDLTVVPVNTDLVEIWALKQTLVLMKEAKDKIPGFEYYVLANKFKETNSNHIEMRNAIPVQFKDYDCRLLDHSLGLRSTFPTAIGAGITSEEVKPRNKKAVDEMTALLDEIKIKLERTK
ncbi:ParA family protein [Acinetobacter radioresistens]|uniref:ParA family protein n=1 Tax=Acinetobacter radioresistens TaxID=40216 RepID=UPI00200508E4|nr:ParA family protein [Acinetobacter radioresistens]MCK4090708.1 ParA family protein [Acinetobacter radioresistens]